MQGSACSNIFHSVSGDALSDLSSYSSNTNSTSATTTITQTVTAPSSSPTGTATALIHVPTNGVLDFNCSTQQTTQSVTIGTDTWTYDLTCSADFNGDAIDLAAPTVYSFSDCIKACSTYSYYTQNVTGCVGVAFNANLTYEVPRNFGNCFLKTYLPAKTTIYATFDPLMVAAAVVASPA
jgi:hypothetical protein